MCVCVFVSLCLCVCFQDRVSKFHVYFQDRCSPGYLGTPSIVYGLKLRDILSSVPALPSYSHYLTVLNLQVEVLGSERCTVIERLALQRTHLQFFVTSSIVWHPLWPSAAPESHVVQLNIQAKSILHT